MARTKRNHSKEFKAEIVRLVLDGGRSVSEVARAHELANSLVSGWVKQAKIDGGKGPAGALTSEERHELGQLRKEVRELKMERDFLKKTAAWFAKQSS